MRMGRKKTPFYRIVVKDGRKKRDGKYLQKIGHYDPLITGDVEQGLVLDIQEYERWVGMGAIPSDTVKHLYLRAKARADEKSD